MKRKVFTVVLLICAALLTGCSGDAASAAGSGNPAQAASAAKDTLVLDGTVGTLPLMRGLADGFRSAGAQNIQIDITAVGKNASIEAVLSGDADLAVIEGSATDIPADVLSETIAFEAVAVVVNPSSGVSDLSSSQITAIFTGESDDWADFGGQGKITIVLPEKNDGFRQVFEDSFDVRAPVNGITRSLVPDTALISANVESDVHNTPGAIGICPLYNLESIKNAVPVDGVAPSVETLKDGAYRAYREIILVIGKEAVEEAGEFFSWCLSKDAGQLIQSIGFTPVK